jgi:dolichol-phosphate mannosyltransferase
LSVPPLLLALLLAQVGAGIVLFARLSAGRNRTPPLKPAPGTVGLPPTSVVVPTLNEADRIDPLLASLALQGDPVVEILVVDSASIDGTRDHIQRAALQDPRMRLLADDPLPPEWVGKAWALEHARTRAQGTWLVTLDADTVLHPGAIAAAVTCGETRQYGAVSFSPRFVGQPLVERWFQPALLTTLLYRSGAGDSPGPNRVLANGQFFAVRRDLLEQHGGFGPVRSSFSEDVSLARHLARAGVRVAFLDGSRIFDVQGYGGFRALWREWGRSIDLKDATSRAQQVLDICFLVLVQALPIPLLVLAVLGMLPHTRGTALLIALNAALLAVRSGMLVALAPAYARRGVAYWSSPLADPLAVLRVVLSTLRRPRRWRTRVYR